MLSIINSVKSKIMMWRQDFQVLDVSFFRKSKVELQNGKFKIYFCDLEVKK